MPRRQRLSPVKLFHHWFEPLQEPVLLLSGTGAVQAVNGGFVRLIGHKEIEGRALADLTSAPPDVVRCYVEACSISEEMVEGVLVFQDAQGDLVSCRCEGAVVYCHPRAANRRILLRLFPVAHLVESGPPRDFRVADGSPPPLEARLQRSEERLRLALEAGQMAIWEWEMKTNQMKGSPGLQELRGRGFGAYVGPLEAYTSDIHPEDRPGFASSLKDLLETGKRHQMEYRLVTPTGEVRWVEDRGNAIYDEVGRPTGIVCITTLIDQRKGFEREIQERLERLARTEAQVRSVIETAVDGIVTSNEKGMILSINPAAQRIFGYTAEEAIGKNVSILMPEPYRSQHDRYLARYLRTGRGRIIGAEREIVGRRKDGAVFPMDLSLGESQVDGCRYFTAILRDTSERKRSENVGHFLADASRCLARVVDYATTLQQVAYLAVPFFADWCAVHIRQEDGSLRQTAAAHLDPDKSEVAQAFGNGYPLDLTSPVGPARVFQTGRSELGEEVPDSLIARLAEDDQHRQVLRDLGLTSFLSVPLAVRGKVLGVMSFFSADPKRKYDLTDLGVAEDLAHRASMAIENALLYSELREAGRRGRQLAPTAAEGEERGSSRPLAGDLQIPGLRPSEPGPLAEAPEASLGAVSTTKVRRILVVEDNVGTAKVLVRLLAKLGHHEIQMVHDGLSALESAAKHHPEIVLLDIGLPHMNGYEVARRLRQQPEFQGTVLVALTGYGTEEDRRRSAEAGFDQHIVKPPSLDHLRQVLAHPKLAESE